jgi:hypothetical protein
MRSILAIFFLFTCASIKAQVNLVKNPDFEKYSQCSYHSDQMSFANFWSGVDSLGISSCVPEYCHVCDTGMGVIPMSPQYYQYPRSGEGMAQVQVFYDEDIPNQYFRRDYLQGRLHSTLTSGQSYCVKFYVVLAELSEHAIDKIGAYLDDGSIDTVDSCGYPLTQYIPQVEAPSLMLDTFNWMKIEGSFAANGTERFITIGNFYDLANTIYTTSGSGSNIHYTWYLVDDVSVIPSDLPAYAGPDVWVAEGDSIFIGRTPEVGLDCYWYVNGNVVDSGAGFYAKPDTTTTYVVQQTLCGQVKTDTVVVSVFPVSVNGITNSRQLSIYPNPATKQLSIAQERIVFTEAVIINNIGQQLSTHKLNAQQTELDISTLPAGVYYLQLSGEKGREIRSFVKM